MGLRETLHNLIHNEEFHHYPLPEELEEPGLVGGRLQEMEEGVQYDPRTQKLQQASDALQDAIDGEEYC